MIAESAIGVALLVVLIAPPLSRWRRRRLAVRRILRALRAQREAMVMGTNGLGAVCAEAVARPPSEGLVLRLERNEAETRKATAGARSERS